MKKTTVVFILLCMIFVVITGCESEEQRISKEAEQIYNEIGQIYFSDESVLSPDEMSTFNSLKQEKERAYRDKDIPALQNVKSDWNEFKRPIQSRIDEIEAEKRRIAEEEARKAEEEARKAEEETQAVINKIVEDAQAASDMLTAFSFGTMDLSISSQGHSIVYTYKYNIDVEDPEAAKSSLELSTSLLTSVFQAYLAELKNAGISSPSVIVEYLDKNGGVIYSTEYK